MNCGRGVPAALLLPNRHRFRGYPWLPTALFTVKNPFTNRFQAHNLRPFRAGWNFGEGHLVTNVFEKTKRAKSLTACGESRKSEKVTMALTSSG
jgi:hypothetical protein